MELRLLGNLEIVTGSGVHGLPGAGERALLAYLALHARRVVPADRLVDALWGEHLPANPSNALQTRVSKLRRALASLGADGAAVATVSPGYRLDMDPGDVDVLLFQRRVSEARAADGGPARDLLAEALDLWRGPALADVDGDWSESESRRLAELRLDALQDRIDLDLAAGRHNEVVVELESLVAAHPLRERLYGQLMVALYRCGRQAEALGVYQSAREALEVELGLDPSAELRDLEAAVLRQDPAIAAPLLAAAKVRCTGNIPARVASLVGRDADVEELIALLEAGRLVTITGPGGAGKTTLAQETARRVSEHFADGAWFVDLSSATDGMHIPAIVVTAMGLPASHTEDEAPAARVARHLQAQECLLVVDNCEQVVDACARFLDRLLALCPNLRVLATSREALAVPGEVQYALAPLPLDEAVDLFAQRARAVSREFTLDASVAPHVQEICTHLDGMPLAVELAAARVKTLPVAEIAARLNDRFALLTSGSRTAQARHQTLRATVDWSYQLLSDPERTVLRRLSVFSGLWSVQAAEEVCADEPVDRGEVLHLVERLVDRSLVVAVGGRFRLLETIRDFAAELLVAAGEFDAVMTRNVHRLLQLAEQAELRLCGDQEAAGMRELRQEHDALRSALRWCLDSGNTALGQQLAGALGWFWYLGDHVEGRRYLDRLIARSDTDDDARGRALHARSIVARPGAVILHPDADCAAAAAESIPLLESAGDTRRAALSRALLAIEGVAGRDVPRCLDLLDEAARALETDPWGKAFTDYVRMKILFRWGDPDEAIALGDRAAEAFDRLGSAWGVGSVRAHQGYDLRILGRLTDSLAANEQSLAAYVERGLLNNMQLLYGDTGITRVLLGDDEGARAYFAAAVDICRRYGYRAGEGMAHLGDGYLARRQGDTATARQHFAEAVNILAGVGHLTVLATAQSALGYALEADGDGDGADQAHRQVLAIARSMHESWVLAMGLEGMAGVELLRGNPRQAAEMLGAAAAVRHETRRPADPFSRSEIDRVASLAVAQLGESSYQTAHARGSGETAARHLAEVAR